MARGEPAPRGKRGPGVAIFVSFGVLCLAAALLVVWSTRACDRMVTPYHPPGTMMPTEPFPGAEAAVAALGSRGCAGPTGPTVGAPGSVPPRARAEDRLDRRGYAAAAERWSETRVLPATVGPDGLEGGCGVIAVAGDSGAVLTGYTADGSLVAPCERDLVLAAACDGDTVRVDGAGVVRTRSFVYPGLTPDRVTSTGVPAEALLAHAEAESHLRSVGWTPTDELVVQTVAPGGSVHRLSPPASASGGCIAWVATGIGVGNANTQWAHRLVDSDPSPDLFTAGLVSCPPHGSAAATTTRLEITDGASDGGTVYMRPYAPAAGPAVPGANERGPALGIADLTVVEPASITLPEGVPVTAPTPP